MPGYDARVSPASYPEHLVAEGMLRDGSTVHLRPARSEDERAVEDYFLGLSDDSRHLRFWTSSVDIGEQARRTVDVDHVDHLTILAFLAGDGGERMVGGAQCFREAGTARAEVALSVTDDLQGRGLGSILVGHLAQAAREVGITSFSAQILPENHRMISVFRDSGFLTTVRARPGIVEVTFPTTITEETVEQYEERERLAAANAVRACLEPTACAVIGASRDPGSIGGRLFRNIVTQPFAGVVYPVHATAPVVQSVTAYRSVLDIPGEVELAFVAVPAAAVVAVAEECGRKGIRALVVISAGFAETDARGVERQDQLLAVCRSYGMRLIGPNCMGVANTDPEVRLDGTFVTAWPPEGNVAFMSQSGALGLAVMHQASALGMGLSSFVSVGNKADISGNDLLCYWEDDPRTSVVLLYLESFGNPQRFGRLARRIGRRKPIVAVKGGRGISGARATSSHTGALLASNDRTVDAVLHQHGVIRTDTLEEMFDVATLLANQPIPEGRNVAIVTNAGGLGIQCADMCEARGLRVPVLGPQTQTALESSLPPEASSSNPIDMIASARPEDYRSAIAAVASDEAIDAVIVIYIPPLEHDAPPVAEAIVEAIAALERPVPVATCFMSARGVPEELSAKDMKIPSYAYPEQAAIAVAHAADHGAWRRRPEGKVPTLVGIDEDGTHAVVAGALARDDEGWLTGDEAMALLDRYGIAVPRSAAVGTPVEAADAAAEMGITVALKAAGPLHKTDVQAVLVDLPPGEVEEAARRMIEHLGERGEPFEGFVVQEMIRDAAEMLVGCAVDPIFGPVIAVGSGGVTVELTRDVAMRVAPITDLDAHDMVRELATFPLLEGFRGASIKDVSALEDVSTLR